MSSGDGYERRHGFEQHGGAIDRGQVALGAGLTLTAALGMSATAEAVNFKVSTLSDSGKGSLRQAVLDANAKNGSDAILFASGLSGTVGLTSGQLAITGPVAIQGSGANRITVSGGNASRIFQIDLTSSGQPVSISGLKLTRGASGAGAGGAIMNVDSALTVSGSVVSGNTTAAGAITSAQAGSSLTLRTSTVSGNVATVGGGLVTAGGGAVLIANSTISGNTASIGAGVLDYGGTGPIAFSGSTIAGNTATTSGGGIYRVGAPMTLTSTIVADNSAPASPDISGTVSAGFSLIENTAGATITSTGPNFLGQDPKLAPLANNGGPTQTQALLGGSPAFDTGLASGLSTDQRGAARPFDLKGIGKAIGGDSSDIGAYERVLCAKVVVNRVGTAGADTLKGTSRADGILGLGGQDTLKGLAGKDGLCGGAGADTLNGGGGNDNLLGGAGPDALVGGKGTDVLKGGGGKDQETP